MFSNVQTMKHAILISLLINFLHFIMLEKSADISVSAEQNVQCSLSGEGVCPLDLKIIAEKFGHRILVHGIALKGNMNWHQISQQIHQ